MLHVPSGATVALVAPSGGGKTTAASLVPRFWDASAGRVLVGGVDVRSIPQAELMERVAFVFQNDKLFKQSLLDNIRAARPEATREEVEAAAHAAQCDDIVAKLPQGLDTVVGARGVYLSGGECQRIALARAILKDAPIVVLDEATAFADPENEALIQRALGVLCAGKTVLMIAHRLSTVAGADAIYVLDGGRLAEQGPTPSWWRRAACTRACGPTIEPRRNGASERRAAMLRDSLGLTDVGAKNFRRGVFFCTLANLVLMAPIGILFLLVSDFMDHLVAGPLPALAPYLAGCVGILALICSSPSGPSTRTRTTRCTRRAPASAPTWPSTCAGCRCRSSGGATCPTSRTPS